jgi:hypothetical protein
MNASSPTDRMVRRKTDCTHLPAGELKSPKHFVRQNEALEDFIRKQPSASSQPDEISLPLQQAAAD